MRQRGFAHTRNVFYQQVPAREKTPHGIVDLGLFSDQHRVKLVQKLLDGSMCAGLWGF